MKYLLSFLFFLIIFIIAATLGVQNNQIVTFNFLLATGEYRLSRLLATLFGGGIILGWLIGGLFGLRNRFALISLQHKLKRLQQSFNETDEKRANTHSPDARN